MTSTLVASGLSHYKQPPPPTSHSPWNGFIKMQKYLPTSSRCFGFLPLPIWEAEGRGKHPLWITKALISRSLVEPNTQHHLCVATPWDSTSRELSSTDRLQTEEDTSQLRNLWGEVNGSFVPESGQLAVPHEAASHHGVKLLSAQSLLTLYVGKATAERVSSRYFHTKQE